MAARFDLITVDTPDPNRLSQFWSQVLGLVEIEREDGDRWVVLAESDGTRRLGFQRGEHVPGGIHLDLVTDVGEFPHELERLENIGAVLLAAARHEPYGMIANLRDPDGNAFDLCAYH